MTIERSLGTYSAPSVLSTISVIGRCRLWIGHCRFCGCRRCRMQVLPPEPVPTARRTAAEVSGSEDYVLPSRLW